jgi:hypothetical protein
MQGEPALSLAQAQHHALSLNQASEVLHRAHARIRSLCAQGDPAAALQV